MDAALPRVLVSGIDTLEVFSRAAVVVEWQERLAESKRWAEDGGKAVNVEVAGHGFQLAPGRSRIAPYLLTSPALALHVNPWAVKGFPQVACELRSAFLWQHGARGALERARHLMAAVSGFAHIEPAVTRVDLAVDFQGWGFAPADAARFRCRARQADTHTVSGECTGFSFGAGGDVLARLYNKTTEIRTKSPDKLWFADVWSRSPAYVAGEDVWRLEFQLRRRGWRTFKRHGEGGGHVEASPMLQEAGLGLLDTYADLERAGRALWAYLTGRWLRIPGKRTKRSRAALDPAWEVIHRDGFDGQRWGGLTREGAPGDWNGYAGDLTRAGRSAVLRRRTPANAGALVREMAVAMMEDRNAAEARAADDRRRFPIGPPLPPWEPPTADELVNGAVRRMELALEARGTDLEARARERLAEHEAALAALMDAMPARRPDRVPDPERPRVACPFCNGRRFVRAGEDGTLARDGSVMRPCPRCDGWGDVADVAPEELPPAPAPVADPPQRALPLPWGERGTGS